MCIILVLGIYVSGHIMHYVYAVIAIPYFAYIEFCPQLRLISESR